MYVCNDFFVALAVRGTAKRPDVKGSQFGSTGYCQSENDFCQFGSIPYCEIDKSVVLSVWQYGVLPNGQTATRGFVRLAVRHTAKLTQRLTRSSRSGLSPLEPSNLRTKLHWPW